MQKIALPIQLSSEFYQLYADFIDDKSEEAGGNN